MPVPYSLSQRATTTRVQDCVLVLNPNPTILPRLLFCHNKSTVFLFIPSLSTPLSVVTVTVKVKGLVMAVVQVQDQGQDHHTTEGDMMHPMIATAVAAVAAVTRAVMVVRTGK